MAEPSLFWGLLQIKGDDPLMGLDEYFLVKYDRTETKISKSTAKINRMSLNLWPEEFV